MVTEIATFIASMNSADENYVGYCGTDPEEIESALQKFEIEPDKAFFLIRENEKITALLGFDLNLSENEAEVWGPFVRNHQWQETASILWQTARKNLLSPTMKLNFFFGTKNRNAINFATALGAEERSENSILVLSTTQVRNKTCENALPSLSAHQKGAFINLHDSLFPSAYFSGQQIVDLVDENNQIFVLEQENELAGYIFVEVNPEHAESTIHFFGVNQKYRGQGLGQRLLSSGVDFILSFQQIQEITLCVESQNHQAIRLYERVGFFSDTGAFIWF